MLVSVVTGPDCAGNIPLSAGRYVVGRSSSAHIRIADVRLGLHHAVLEVDVDAVTVTPLSGEAPVRLDGEAVAGTQRFNLPARISIGMNQLQIIAAHRGADGPHTPGCGIAAPAIESASEPINPPRRVEVRPAPPATALTAAGVLLGAVMIAVVLGHGVVARVGVVGAVSAVVTWLAGALSSCRGNWRARRDGEIDRRRFLDDLARARVSARNRHLLLHLSVARVIATTETLAGAVPLQTEVWQHRLGGGSGTGRATFCPIIGLGSTRWSPVMDGGMAGDAVRDLDVFGRDIVTDIERGATIDDVAIPVALACGEITAISGGEAERDALLRSILCQMAVRHGPTDWQLLVVSAARPKWSWVGWLPQAHSDTGTVMYVDPSDSEHLESVVTAAAETRRPTLLVVDDSAFFALRPGVLRRLVERVEPATLITFDAGATLPDVCRTVITVGSTGLVSTARCAGRAQEDGSAGFVDEPTFGHIAETASAVQMCGLSMERAAHVACLLGRRTDPAQHLVPGTLVLDSSEEGGRANQAVEK